MSSTYRIVTGSSCPNDEKSPFNNVEYSILNSEDKYDCKKGCSSLKCHLTELENKVTQVIRNVSYSNRTVKTKSVKNVIFNYLSWTKDSAIKTSNFGFSKDKDSDPKERSKFSCKTQTSFENEPVAFSSQIVDSSNKICTGRSRNSSYNEKNLPCNVKFGDSAPSGREKLCDDEIKLFLDNVCVVNSDETLILEPSVSHLIQNVSRPQELEDSIRIKGYRNIVATVNDSDGYYEGSHWSVLAYEGSSRSYFHLDSLNGYNTRCAEHLAYNLELCRGNKHIPSVRNIPCLQQGNGIDCGYYMLNNTKVICDMFNSNLSLAGHSEVFGHPFCIDSIACTLGDLQIKNSFLRPFSSVVMDDELVSFSKKTKLLCWGSPIVDSFHDSQ